MDVKTAENEEYASDCQSGLSECEVKEIVDYIDLLRKCAAMYATNGRLRANLKLVKEADFKQEIRGI